MTEGLPINHYSHDVSWHEVRSHMKINFGRERQETTGLF